MGTHGHVVMGHAGPLVLSDEERRGFMRPFARHFVRLGWIDRTPAVMEINGGREFYGSASGFVALIQGEWIWMTSGHVFHEIEQYFHEKRILDTWYLDDLWGGHLATGDKDMALPFKAPEGAYAIDQDGADYGFLVIPDHWRRLLWQGGIRPLEEACWRGVPERCDTYWLLGVPQETVKAGTRAGSVQKQTLVTRVEPISKEEAPECLWRPFPLFYGQLPDRFDGVDGEISSIKGMSGGPIFGVNTLDENTCRYWVTHIQSCWHRPSRVISACPVEYFADIVDRAIREINASTS